MQHLALGGRSIDPQIFRPPMLDECNTVRARNEEETQRRSRDTAQEPKTTQMYRPRSFQRTRFSRVAFTVLFSATCLSCLFRAQAVPVRYGDDMMRRCGTLQLDLRRALQHVMLGRTRSGGCIRREYTPNPQSKNLEMHGFDPSRFLILMNFPRQK